jgi:hypothetical protein
MNRSVVLRALIAVGLVSSLGHARPQVAEEPRFDIQIQTAEKRSTYTATNLAGKAVTACVVRFSFSPTNKEQGTTIWDSVLTDEPPIEPSGHMSGNLSHVVGSPYPDKVKVIAGVWADGETFGQSDWVKHILSAREMLASAYERAASLLRRGLDENWTRDQYLQALNETPNSIAVYTLRSNLTANQQMAEDPKRLRHLMISMLDTFTGKYQRIRRAKPAASAATNS